MLQVVGLLFVLEVNGNMLNIGLKHGKKEVKNKMKLFISTKSMTFEEDNIEHEIILKVSYEEFYGYDEVIELSDNGKFIKDTLKIFYKKDKKGDDTKEIDYKEFVIREQKTWNNFPLYELKDGEIILFNYKDYQYFKNTDRRMVLVDKISSLYSSPSELKILRKTFKYIMDTLNIEYPDFFKKYDDKIEEIINKNPKGDK